VGFRDVEIDEGDSSDEGVWIGKLGILCRLIARRVAIQKDSIQIVGDGIKLETIQKIDFDGSSTPRAI
jgi:hypothetical protein